MDLLEVQDADQTLAFRVCPQAGAELSSLRVRWQDRWVETLWRADLQDVPPKYWQGRAPWLWPGVGRSFTDDVLAQVVRTGEDPDEGAYVLDGQTYPLPTHGFAMRRPWDVVSADGDSIRCRLTDDAETRRQYPFGFAVTTWFRIERASVVVDFEVCADAGNATPMPFGVANHITLGLPLGSDADYADCELFSPATHECVLTPESLLDGTTRPLPLGAGRRLADSSLGNMVVGGLSTDDAWAGVWCPGGFGMRSTQRVVRGQSFAPDATHWYYVFYGDADEGLFCPEPWISGPNSLNTGQGLVALPPGETFTWQFIVTPLWERPA